MNLQIKKNGLIYYFYSFIVPSYRIQDSVSLCKLFWIALLGFICVSITFLFFSIYTIWFYTYQSLKLLYKLLFCFEYPKNITKYFNSTFGMRYDSRDKYYHKAFSMMPFAERYLTVGEFEFRPWLFILPYCLYIIYTYGLNDNGKNALYIYFLSIFIVYCLFFIIKFLYESEIINLIIVENKHQIFSDDPEYTRVELTIFNCIPIFIKSVYKKVCPIVKIVNE